ncbi:MAG: c-type cytochrome [Thermoanaerobaculia bacterium]
MRRTIVNVVLLLLTIGLLSLNWLVRSDAATRNFDVLPNMVESVPYDSFARNPNFADGKTLREPVPGTVFRGHLPLHYAATPADAVRAGLELTSPPASVARGAIVYANFCETCHGPAGKGDGRVAQRGFPAPPSFLAPKALQMRDGQMFHVLTYGQNNMPSYASQIAREDRWAAIAYVRTLQGVGVGSRQLPVASGQLPVAGGQLPVASSQLPVARKVSVKPDSPGNWPLATGNPVEPDSPGNRPLATGYRPLATGYPGAKS